MKTRDLHRAEPRHDEIKSHHIEEEVHDPYKSRKKAPRAAPLPEMRGGQCERSLAMVQRET